MKELCPICSRSVASEDCFVRIFRKERPTCRRCWEQVLLDPARVLRLLRDLGVYPSLPEPATS